jgi:hypothetical protein
MNEQDELLLDHTRIEMMGPIEAEDSIGVPYFDIYMQSGSLVHVTVKGFDPLPAKKAKIQMLIGDRKLSVHEEYKEDLIKLAEKRERVLNLWLNAMSTR